MAGISRRRLLATAAALALVAGVAACGDDGGGAKKTGETIINAVSGPAANFTDNFNPFSQQPLSGTRGMIYESLVFVNRTKANEVQPLLATSYELTDDGKTVNLVLRDGVKWNDGQPFSADDVVYTFNLMKNNEKLNLNGIPIAAATASDPTHVTLTFSTSVNTKIGLIVAQTAIVPQHIWSKIADPSTDINAKPVGTGAFKVRSFSAQAYILEKNPQYWDAGKPKIDGIRFRALATNESVTAALVAGELDWAGAFIADVQKQFISKDPEHNKFVSEPGQLMTNLVPNYLKPLTGDEAVRKAISNALDRERIIKLAFVGQGLFPTLGYLPQPIYKDFIKPEYLNTKIEYAPQESARLLEADGWVKGSDGIYAKGGKRLSLTVKVVSGYSDYISALQIITENLKAVGIELKTQQVSFNAFVSAQQTGDFELLITNSYAGFDAYSWYENQFSTEQTAPLGKNANQNFSRFTDPGVDAALKTIEGINPKDVDAIRTQLYKIQDIVVPKLPYVPVYQPGAGTQFRTTKVIGWPTPENHYALGLAFGDWDPGIVAKNLVPVGKG